MHPIIKVENLGKRYNIGRRQSYRTLRESVIETVSAPVRGIAGLLSRNGHEKRDSDPHVWALRDLSFEVAPVKCSASSGATARANLRCSRFFRGSRSRRP